MIDLTRRAAIVLRDVDDAEGTSMRQHNEPAGGQDVWHFHLHVFPRWTGDNLYGVAAEADFAPTSKRADRAAALGRHPGWAL